MSDDYLPEEFRAYQSYLDQAEDTRWRYLDGQKIQGNLEPDSTLEHEMDAAYDDLMAHQYLPKTQRQEMTTRFLTGDHYRLLDLRNPAADQNWQHIDYLGLAAQSFESAAAMATYIEDWALVSDYKFRVAGAYAGSRAYRARYRLAYVATGEALSAWFQLAQEWQTKELVYVFTLADTLATRAIIVGEDKAAVEALELAAFILFRLRERPDFSAEDDTDLTLYLDWDWASLYSSLGFPRLAFHTIVRAWHSSGMQTSRRNKVRLARVITTFALDLAEGAEMTATDVISSSSRGRLIQLVAKRLPLIERVARTRGDQEAVAQALLVRARWAAMSRSEPEESRMDLLRRAQKIAGEINDIVLFGQIEIAWGDEYRDQQKYALAKSYYEHAERELGAVGCVDFARRARRKLARLPQSAFDGDAEPPSWGPSLN